MNSFFKTWPSRLSCLMGCLSMALPLLAQPPAQMREREEQALKEPFVGVTTDGKPIPDLFPSSEQTYRLALYRRLLGPFCPR